MSLGGFGVGLFALSVNTRRPEALTASLSRQTGVHSHRRQTLDLMSCDGGLLLCQTVNPGGSFRVALGCVGEDPCIEASNASAATSSGIGAGHPRRASPSSPCEVVRAGVVVLSWRRAPAATLLETNLCPVKMR